MIQVRDSYIMRKYMVDSIIRILIVSINNLANMFSIMTKKKEMEIMIICTI